MLFQISHSPYRYLRLRGRNNLSVLTVPVQSTLYQIHGSLITPRAIRSLPSRRTDSLKPPKDFRLSYQPLNGSRQPSPSRS